MGAGAGTKLKAEIVPKGGRVGKVRVGVRVWLFLLFCLFLFFLFPSFSIVPGMWGVLNQKSNSFA